MLYLLKRRGEFYDAIHPSKEPWTQASHVQSLSVSIHQQGLLNPLVVVKNDKRYLVLSGTHRLQALKILRVKTAPCIVLSGEEEGEILMNILHLDSKQRITNALQEGQLLYQLLNLGNSQIELAEIVNKSTSWVQHRMALVVSLTPKVQDMIARNYLSPRKAQSIARLPIEKQEFFARKVKEERLSVQEVDQLVALFNKNNTDDEMKEKILNLPLFVLKGTKIKPKKGVSSDVRSICFSIREMKKSLENIKEILTNRKEVKSVEKREIKKCIEETEQVLGELRCIVEGTRKGCSSEVSIDPSDSVRGENSS